MRHSVEPRNRIYVKGYRFMSFARSRSNKYGKKLVDTVRKSATDAIKTASKIAIQKSAEATGGFIRNKVADKITSFSKKKSNNNINNNDDDDDHVELSTHKKRCISPEKRQQIIDELRLVPRN